MPSASSVLPPALQLRGSAFTFTVLEIVRPDAGAFSQELAERMAQAPQLLRDAPVVLALERLDDGAAALDLATLLALCRRHTLHPVAVRARRPDDIAQAARLGLAVLPARRRERARETAAGDGATPGANADVHADAAPAAAGGETAPTPLPASARTTRVVTQPVRGGQQIYAPGDLVLLAPVSAGAEVMADGHIHVYAPLRGRALAGVQGDATARVFCRELGAELVAIAGHYRIAEELKSHALWGKSAQLLLRDEALEILAL